MDGSESEGPTSSTSTTSAEGSGTVPYNESEERPVAPGATDDESDDGAGGFSNNSSRSGDESTDTDADG